MIRDPFAPPGLSVGLFGGSFDPPHAGHLHVIETALRRLRLDRVWMLVTPGNPLKARGPADIARRMAAARALTAHLPRVTVTDIEARLGTPYSADLLRHLEKAYPRARFVWIMGADNLATFHRWKDWDMIMRAMPVAVFARPGQTARAGLGPAARRFAAARRPDGEAERLAGLQAPAWILFSSGPTSPLSSTAIRKAGGWP